MTDETKILQRGWQDDLTSYYPITAKIRSLIASQQNFTEKGSPLHDNATLISKCIGAVPKRQFEQDWNSIARTLLIPRPLLMGIGACVGPNNVNSAVKEALRYLNLDKSQIGTSKIVVGIFGGPDINGKIIERIVNLVSKALHQDIYSKVISYDKMQDVIAVLIMATP